jgi:outer membrane protein assembly factor BamB
MLIGSPAVTEGKIYVAGTDGYLFAIDAESGALQCKFAAKSRIPSSVAMSGKTVANDDSRGSTCMECSQRARSCPIRLIAICHPR